MRLDPIIADKPPIKTNNVIVNNIVVASKIILIVVVLTLHILYSIIADMFWHYLLHDHQNYL